MVFSASNLIIQGSTGGSWGVDLRFHGSTGGSWGVIVTLFIVYYRYLMHFISEFGLADSGATFCSLLILN